VRLLPQVPDALARQQVSPGVDGLFPDQKSQFEQILEGLRWENVDIGIVWPFGIFHGHLGYFMTVWYVMYVFTWYIFSGFGIMYQEKSGNSGQFALINDH
jgi:hypothetical protein